MMENEEWKVIEDFPNYAVSNFGRVKNIKKSKINKPEDDDVGYFSIHLSNPPHRSKRVRVHRLVLKAFYGSCPEGKESNHKDGNKKNNNSDNLEYVTKSENIKHAHKNGLVKKHGGPFKLVSDQKFEIRRLKINGIKTTELSKRFNVSTRHINFLCAQVERL